MNCSRTTKILSLFVVLFLCAASFVGGAVFGKKYGYDYAFRQGFTVGQIELTKEIADTTEQEQKISKEEWNKNCQHMKDLKDMSLFVCTINGVKTIALYDYKP